MQFNPPCPVATFQNIQSVGEMKTLAEDVGATATDAATLKAAKESWKRDFDLLGSLLVLCKNSQQSV
eukprot:12018187-Alexandrium_andersonii.AAC.2